MLVDILTLPVITADIQAHNTINSAIISPITKTKHMIENPCDMLKHSIIPTVTMINPM